MPAPTATRAAEEEVGIIHRQIEQCLVMSFDKPTTIALVTEAVFLRARLRKSVAFEMVQLVWDQLVKENQLWFAKYQPRKTLHNTYLVDYKFTQEGLLQRKSSSLRSVPDDLCNMNCCVRRHTAAAVPILSE